MLRNVHLCASWLVTLEKRLHALKPHANFRLFLTSEIHPQLPVGRRCCWVLLHGALEACRALLTRVRACVCRR